LLHILTFLFSTAKNVGAAKAFKLAVPAAAEAYWVTGLTRILIVMVLLDLRLSGKFLIISRMARMGKRNMMMRVWGMRRVRGIRSI
jgi:hypothetical protein